MQEFCGEKDDKLQITRAPREMSRLMEQMIFMYVPTFMLGWKKGRLSA
jgi:hypothetical protein